MQQFYEKLISRMTGLRKPAPAIPEFPTKKVAEKQLGFHPFITISREPGSGGRPIAQTLARVTGFRHYNRSLIEAVAKSAKKRRELIESIDERGRSSVQDFAHSLFNPEYMSDVEYVRHLSHVILTLAERGDCIILGRGANFFTSHVQGLHVRVMAPYEVRLERAIKYERISARKAKSVIRKIDADRKMFVKQYFTQDIDDTKYYDVVLNTTNMTIDDAVKIILKAFELRFPGYLKRFKLREKRKR